MAQSDNLAAIQNCLSNSLGGVAIGNKAIAGVLGDAPSQYSKSPRLWNAAFDQLGLEAVYLPFDIAAERLGELMAQFKKSPRFWGANVTVPHKVRVMDFLDEIDPGARRVDAVNTIVRTAAGRLIGYNTDGEGFIASLLRPQEDRAEGFIASLDGVDVLLLGAGGSARAVAFHTADLLGAGTLLICNRTLDHAASLADGLKKNGRSAAVIGETELSRYASAVGLIINSTTKGQAGIRKLPDGTVTKLEPYSALAPVHPPALAESELVNPNFARFWAEAAEADIEANHRASLALAESIPSHVRFYDLIYHPEETVFLRHGRITGHPTLNGKAMIINQAVIAFANHLCRAHLEAHGMDPITAHKKLLRIMERAW